MSVTLLNPADPKAPLMEKSLLPLTDFLIRVLDDQQEPVAGALVVLTRRPGSHHQLVEEVELGATDARGELAWTPDQPGLVRLSASKEGESLVQTEFSIRFDSMPLSGMTIAIFLAILYFGVGGWLVLSLLGSKEEKPSPKS